MKLRFRKKKEKKRKEKDRSAADWLDSKKRSTSRNVADNAETTIKDFPKEERREGKILLQNGSIGSGGRQSFPQRMAVLGIHVEPRVIGFGYTRRRRVTRVTLIQPSNERLRTATRRDSCPRNWISNQPFPIPRSIFAILSRALPPRFASVASPEMNSLPWPFYHVTGSKMATAILPMSERIFH